MGMILGVIGIGLQLAGAAKAAEGARLQGTANAEAYGYQAMIAKNNAAIELQNQGWIGAQGQTEAMTELIKTAAGVGGMKAAEGASGVEVNTGSFVNARGAAAGLGMENARTIESNATRAGWEAFVRNQTDQMQAQADKRAAIYSYKAGQIGAQANILSGAAGAFSSASSLFGSMSSGGGGFFGGGSSGYKDTTGSGGYVSSSHSSYPGMDANTVSMYQSFHG